MIKLNVIDANSQVIEATLDEETFYIVLDWNSSNSSWTMDVRNAEYDTLISGIAVVPNELLLRQFRYSSMPKGDLCVGFTKDRNGPIPRNGFEPNQGYELIYIEAEDFNDAV